MWRIAKVLLVSLLAANLAHAEIPGVKLIDSYRVQVDNDKVVFHGKIHADKVVGMESVRLNTPLKQLYGENVNSVRLRVRDKPGNPTNELTSWKISFSKHELDKGVVVFTKNNMHVFIKDFVNW